MGDKPISIGYFAPGWPLSGFPNGIVAYIENIISGFDRTLVSPFILANEMLADYRGEVVLNLSNFAERQLIERLIDRILFRVSEQDAIRKVIGRRIVRALNRITFSIDILEMEESFGASKLVADNLSIPVITRLHGPWFLIGDVLGVKHDRSFKQRIKFEGEAIYSAKAISSPCKVLLDQVRTFYGLELPNAVVIPNPAPIVNDPKYYWQLENCTEKVILFVGRFDRVKGGDLIIDAFRLIAEKDKDVRLHFVGPDQGLVVGNDSISLVEYIQNRVEDITVRNRIHCLGPKNAEQIRLERRDAYVTLVTSRYENFPMTLLEALAQGCPVVSTAVGGVKEIITDGFNGLLSECTEAESLAEKSLMLLNNEALMQELSQNAIEDCLERFHPKVVAAQTLDFYRTVIAEQP